MASRSNVSFKNTQTLAVIIPMFNEEHVAARCVEKVVAVIKRLKQSTTIVVINDGSTDNTENILQEKLKKYPHYLTVITYKKNKGYGKATQAGIQEAMRQNVTWVLHMDSDLTNDPKYIPIFLQAARNDVDCVKASRYIHGSHVKNVPLYRRIISSVGNYMAHFLFGVGIVDCTNGFRLVRTSKIKGLHFKEKNFSIILEELYYLKKRHATFAEIPYTLTARSHSLSHFSYKPIVFFNYFKYALLSFLYQM